MTQWEYVRLEPDEETAGAVTTLRFDRAPMNPLDSVLQREISEAAEQLGADRAVRAVVVYGGPKTFAAGADVKEMAAMSYVDMVEFSGPLQDAFTTVAAIPKPTVAAVTGYALGGGLELALCCDFRVAGDNARLGQPEILLGIIPGAGGTQRLPRLIGPARAKDLIFSGRHVRADEALAIGLVDEVVGADDVHAAALARMRRYAKGPAVALRAAKQAIDEGLDTTLDAGLRIERKVFAGLFATEDRSIGMDTFVESGPGKAEFVGR